MGTHEELLRDSELYNEILDSQVLAEPVAAGGAFEDPSTNGREG
jgi:hypothetical protein